MIRPRKQIGFIEEYCVRNGRNYEFAGTRTTTDAEPCQPTGSNNATFFKLDSDLEIKRSFSKTRILKAGTEVRRMVYPLQGREIA